MIPFHLWRNFISCFGSQRTNSRVLALHNGHICCRNTLRCKWVIGYSHENKQTDLQANLTRVLRTKMTMLELFYFGHIAQRPSSLEKALMLGTWKESETEDKRQQSSWTQLQ